MSIEGTPKFEQSETNESFERKKLRVANEVQVLIWNKVCSPDDNEEGECIQDWVDNYGDSFRTIFNEVLSRDPKFLDKWDSDVDERFNSRDFFIHELEKLDGPDIKKAA